MCSRLPLAPWHTGMVETEADHLIGPVDHLLRVEFYHLQGVGKLFFHQEARMIAALLQKVGKLFWKGTDSTYFSFGGYIF